MDQPKYERPVGRAAVRDLDPAADKNVGVRQLAPKWDRSAAGPRHSPDRFTWFVRR